MSQLGIPKMRQTSTFLWHKPASPAVGTYVSRARETTTNPRSTGLREALCGHVRYVYGTESGATHRPRVPFPKSISREPWSPGGLKRKEGPKRKTPVDDRGSNKMTTVRAHLQNSVALYVKIGVKACQHHNQAGTSE